MLRNYYFTRRGIVGGSWFGNFKGWDSAVSSRNIFKNTAYYNANVITDNNWKAHIEFNLPDNLTNFRIMAVANSKKNFFGMWSSNIEVRKNVIVSDKTPLILRPGDVSKIWAQIFNNTKKDIWFKIELETNWVDVRNKTKNITIQAWESYFASFEIIVPKNIKNINYTIKALWNSVDNSDKVEGNIEIKKSPVLITNIIKNLTIPEFNKKAWANETTIKIPENTDIKNSKVEVIFSNNKLVWIEKIVSSLAHYPYWCIEQTISSTLPNAIVLKFSRIFWNNIIDKSKAEKNIKAWIDRLETMQLKSGWFAYWQEDTTETDLEINSYVLSAMIDMQKVYSSPKLNKLIDNSIKYLENQFSPKLALDKQIDIFYALEKAWKKVKLELNSDKLNRNQLIKYTYWLFYNNKNLYKKEIEKNIEKIQKLFENNNEKYSYYSNSINEKALFARLLLDWNYNKNYAEKLIWELYEKDFSSYYYSTKTKANSFLAFAKYLEKNSINKINRFWFSIWIEFNRWKVLNVWWKNILKKFEYNLWDLLLKWENKIDFKWVNLSKGNLYATVILKQFPKDILKVKPYSNKVNISRKIYEVLDEVSLDKCNNYWNYWYYDWEDKNIKKECDNALREVRDNTFKKWKLYLVKNKVNFTDRGDRRNFVIEDYLPGTFRILNSKFKTESALLKQNTRNWSWNHIEYRPNVVMANASYIWWNDRTFSYFVRPEFAWLYTYPPTTGYFMYNPLIRANSEFSVIEVK